MFLFKHHAVARQLFGAGLVLVAGKLQLLAHGVGLRGRLVDLALAFLQPFRSLADGLLLLAEAVAAAAVALVELFADLDHLAADGAGLLVLLVRLLAFLPEPTHRLLAGPLRLFAPLQVGAGGGQLALLLLEQTVGRLGRFGLPSAFRLELAAEPLPLFLLLLQRLGPRL